MAEEFAKFKRFEYRTNSNLVLQREGAAPSQNEPTGEPESLRGKVYHRMGDLVKHDKPKEIEEMMDKKRKKETAADQGIEKKAKLDINKGETVLSSDVTEVQIYRPRTRATASVYEQLLSSLQTVLGDQSPDVLRGAADEILAAIKTDGILDSERKSNVEEVVGVVTEETFANLYRLSKQITDFGADVEDEEEEGPKKGIDDATGVAVVFDEEDEEEEGDLVGELAGEESEDDDDDAIVEERDDHGLQVGGTMMDDEEEMEAHLEKESRKYDLDIQKIDAHWLQRELGKYFNDPNKCVATEKEILSILAVNDLQKCENQLVQVLQYENFEFTKLLLRNRLKVLYCTRLGQAQTGEEKHSVMEDMRQNPEAHAVIEELERSYRKRDKEKDVTRDLRKEARKIAARNLAAGQADMDEAGFGKKGERVSPLASAQTRIHTGI